MMTTIAPIMIKVTVASSCDDVSFPSSSLLSSSLLVSVKKDDKIIETVGAWVEETGESVGKDDGDGERGELDGTSVDDRGESDGTSVGEMGEELGASDGREVGLGKVGGFGGRVVGKPVGKMGETEGTKKDEGAPEGESVVETGDCDGTNVGEMDGKAVPTMGKPDGESVGEMGDCDGRHVGEMDGKDVPKMGKTVGNVVGEIGDRDGRDVGETVGKNVYEKSGILHSATGHAS
eukprot:638245_1